MAAHAPCAVVTGAATGIGRATADALVRDGFGVALVRGRAEPLQELAAELGRGHDLDPRGRHLAHADQPNKRGQNLPPDPTPLPQGRY